MFIVAAVSTHDTPASHTLTKETMERIEVKNGSIEIITTIAQVERRPVASGSRIIMRWFHNLSAAEDQAHGLGQMTKKRAVDEAVKLYRIDRSILADLQAVNS